MPLCTLSGRGSLRISSGQQQSCSGPVAGMQSSRRVSHHTVPTATRFHIIPSHQAAAKKHPRPQAGGPFRRLCASRCR